MRRYDADGRIPTLDVAVSEFMNAEDSERVPIVEWLMSL